MNVHVFDPHVAREIVRNRESADSGHRDEVWEGEYFVMPDPNNEHQGLIGKLVLFLGIAVTLRNLGTVVPGGNISDRVDDWTQNYRIPDVAVYLNETSAVDRGTHWFGGPELAIEIVSPEDLSREKLPFYAKVGTREVLIIDRDPWTLELYRLREGSLELVGVSKSTDSTVLASEVVPLSFRLIADENRPAIEIKSLQNDQTWII